MKYELKKEIVEFRTGEPLEDELQNRGIHQTEQARLIQVIDEFSNCIEMTEELRQKFEYLEEAQILYDIAYGETAYSLGYSDGIEVGVEKGIDGKNTILSVKDMANLIIAYDAIRKMNKSLLGGFELCKKEERILECIFDVIDNGIAIEYKLLGEEGLAKVVSILNDNTLTPEKRAKKLLAIE